MGSISAGKWVWLLALVLAIGINIRRVRVSVRADQVPGGEVGRGGCSGAEGVPRSLFVIGGVGTLAKGASAAGRLPRGATAMGGLPEGATAMGGLPGGATATGGLVKGASTDTAIGTAVTVGGGGGGAGLGVGVSKGHDSSDSTPNYVLVYCTILFSGMSMLFYYA